MSLSRALRLTMAQCVLPWRKGTWRSAKAWLRYHRMAALTTRGNLEERAQDTQLRIGVAFVSVGLAMAIALRHVDVGAGVRALLFLPFFVGAYGVQAGLYKVCGINALFGRRITEEGPRPVADPRDLADYRRTGIRIFAVSAALAALAATLVVVAR
jgi:hypothetical protein